MRSRSKDGFGIAYLVLASADVTEYHFLVLLLYYLATPVAQLWQLCERYPLYLLLLIFFMAGLYEVYSSAQALLISLQTHPQNPLLPFSFPFPFASLPCAPPVKKT